MDALGKYKVIVIKMMCSLLRVYVVAPCGKAEHDDGFFLLQVGPKVRLFSAPANQVGPDAKGRTFYHVNFMALIVLEPLLADKAARI